MMLSFQEQEKKKKDEPIIFSAKVEKREIVGIFYKIPASLIHILLAVKEKKTKRRKN